MSNCVSVKARLDSIMEALTNAAVAEINKLFDDSSAVLFLEISRSQKENQALKKKLQLIECDLRSARGGENSERVCGTHSLFRNEEQWPAGLEEEEPPLIKKEWPEADWGGSDPQLDICTERRGAEDMVYSHQRRTPADSPAQHTPGGGAGELSENVEWNSNMDTDDSECFDTTGKDSDILLLHPELKRFPSTEEGAKSSLKTEPGGSRTVAIKEEAMVLPTWGKLVEGGSAVLRLEIYHSQKENETLRRKLQAMENELKTAREYGKKIVEERNVFATHYCVAAEEDLRQCAVAVEQSAEEEALLPESLIKKESLEDLSENVDKEWREDVLEAEGCVDVEWGLGLNQDPPACTQPTCAVGDGEPCELHGDGEEGYSGSSTQLELFPVAEAGGLESFKEELCLQPMWPDEAGPGIGPSPRGQHVRSRATPLGRGIDAPCPWHVGQLVKPCTVRVEYLELQGPLRQRPDPTANDPLAGSSHTPKRPFLCTHCGKAFTWNISLKRHLQIHIQERPFSCPQCPSTVKLTDKISEDVYVQLRSQFVEFSSVFPLRIVGMHPDPVLYLTVTGWVELVAGLLLAFGPRILQEISNLVLSVLMMVTIFTLLKLQEPLYMCCPATVFLGLLLLLAIRGHGSGTPRAKSKTQ
ncbi:hypothetical protein AAFF_G00431060 [Aldrovandia affinis]|uniref:C2H2-type domain-containing protein n=1 Tax=Aldrovandia affinis TaxID=143900 RepID=A0AAD7S8S8_9TELE|nr:hypothetical protein AAFF_G00431060 [Aldrovandia affinis]